MFKNVGASRGQGRLNDLEPRARRHRRALFTPSEAVGEAAEEDFARADVALSINLMGAVFVNRSAALQRNSGSRASGDDPPSRFYPPPSTPFMAPSVSCA